MIKHPNITVLYVDDEPNNLFLFEASFRRTYKVITAEKPSEGLAKLDQHESDIIIVISDMRMPEMNGIEFIKKAKDKYESKFYFILTGFDFDNEIQTALDDQLIQKFFKKPFDPEEIEEAIEEALNAAQS